MQSKNPKFFTYQSIVMLQKHINHNNTKICVQDKKTLKS